jgi:hypothetical protein
MGIDRKEENKRYNERLNERGLTRYSLLAPDAMIPRIKKFVDRNKDKFMNTKIYTSKEVEGLQNEIEQLRNKRDSLTATCNKHKTTLATDKSDTRQDSSKIQMSDQQKAEQLNYYVSRYPQLKGQDFDEAKWGFMALVKDEAEKVEIEKANKDNNKLTTYYNVREGYYLCFDPREDNKYNPAKPEFPRHTSTGVFYCKDTDKKNIQRLIHKGTKKQTHSMSLVGHVEVKNLNKKEFEELAKMSLPFNKLIKAYESDSNFKGTPQFDFESPILIG